jgi:hypothetical protein
MDIFTGLYTGLARISLTIPSKFYWLALSAAGVPGMFKTIAVHYLILC